MKGRRDKRIQFVLPTDGTYLFVDSSGNATYHDWFSFMQRRPLGNVKEEGFHRVAEKLNGIHKQHPTEDETCEEDFINRMQDAPLWARYYDGNYDVEELNGMSPKYWESFLDIVRLHGKRVQGINISRSDL